MEYVDDQIGQSGRQRLRLRQAGGVLLLWLLSEEGGGREGGVVSQKCAMEKVDRKDKRSRDKTTNDSWDG